MITSLLFLRSYTRHVQNHVAACSHSLFQRVTATVSGAGVTLGRRGVLSADGARRTLLQPYVDAARMEDVRGGGTRQFAQLVAELVVAETDDAGDVGGRRWLSGVIRKRPQFVDGLG